MSWCDLKGFGIYEFIPAAGGVLAGVFDAGFLSALPGRIFGTVNNTTLIAVPLFILMGSSIPLLVYWIALPVSNRRQALESAIVDRVIDHANFGELQSLHRSI